MPVKMVSWFDAVEYCNKHSELEGLLPCYTIDKNKLLWKYSFRVQNFSSHHQSKMIGMLFSVFFIFLLGQAIRSINAACIAAACGMGRLPQATRALLMRGSIGRGVKIHCFSRREAQSLPEFKPPSLAGSERGNRAGVSGISGKC